MEIKDYLKAIGRRAWVVILVPLLAGALALAYQVGQPASFQSTVTVVSHPGSAASGSVIQYITSFQAAMSSDTIINEVAQQTGSSSGAIRSGLSSQPSGANSVILRVSYTSTKRAKVTKVPDLAARDTLELLGRPSVISAQAILDADTSAYNRAKAAADDFTKQTGVLIPMESYRQELGYVSNLQVAYEQAVLQGQPTAKGLKALIDAEQTKLGQLGSEASQWQRLNEIEVRNASSVADAQTRLAEAQAQLTALQDPTAVTPGDTSKLSPVPTLIKVIGPVVVVALVLSIGLIVLLETMQARRRRRSEEALSGASPPNPNANTDSSKSDYATLPR